MAQQLSSKCNSSDCENEAFFRITYDCDPDADQILMFCQKCYESYETMPSGDKVYWFKKFAKNVEVLQN